MNKCEVAIDEYKSKCDNSIKSNLELKDKIQIGLDTVQKAMSNNWNIMKHIVLTMVHKEYQYLNGGQMMYLFGLLLKNGKKPQRA